MTDIPSLPALIAEAAEECWRGNLTPKWLESLIRRAYALDRVEWRGMDSAPKDGDWVQVYDPEGVRTGQEDEDGSDFIQHVFMAAWSGREWTACFGQVETWGCESGGYDSNVAGFIVNPTAWQPLPALPGDGE